MRTTGYAHRQHSVKKPRTVPYRTHQVSLYILHKKRNLTEVRTISIVTPLQPAPQTLEFLQTKKQRESALSVEIVRRTRSMRTDNVASAVCGILHKNILSTAIVIAWFTGFPTKQIPPGG